MVRASYDIIYKNVVKKSDSNLMAMEHFFDAIEVLSEKLFNVGDAYENLNELI